MAALTAEARRDLLQGLAKAYADAGNQREIFEANGRDLESAEAAQARGEMAPALVKRLVIDEKKIAALCDGLEQMASAPELTGQITLPARVLTSGFLRCD